MVWKYRLLSIVKVIPKTDVEAAAPNEMAAIHKTLPAAARTSATLPSGERLEHGSGEGPLPEVMAKPDNIGPMRS